MFWFANEWYIFDGAISEGTCNRIIKQGEGQFSQADVHGRGKNQSDILFDPGYRTSEIAWTNEQWIYDLIWPYMIRANQNTRWNLDIQIAEDMQITRYKKGGFYAWHRDGLSDNSPVAIYDNPKHPRRHGKVRKMSMTMLLNDDFEGGELEFASYEHEKCIITPIKPNRGDIIFFTAGKEHRVAPVTKGTRYSLVSWFSGPPIK